MRRVTPGLWRTRGETRRSGRAATSRSGRPGRAESTNFAVWAPEAHRRLGLPLRRRRRARPGTGSTEQHPRHLARRPPRRRGRAALRLPGRRAVGPRRRACGSTRSKLLLDPYARAVSGDARRRTRRSSATTPATPTRARRPPTPRPYVAAQRGRATTTSTGAATRPLRRRWRDTVIYELHVKGMTAAARPGPRGAARHVRRARPRPRSPTTCATSASPRSSCCRSTSSSPSRAVAERGLVNYWGYNSIGFFAPHAAYSSSGDRGEQVTEFKQMVKAFHEAGLEVILDVVYNHTAEAGADGPTLSLPRARRQRSTTGSRRRAGEPFADTYWDVTGCGNTVDAAHPFALRLILDSLRYWVTEMHVDGFRFDLLSALTRTGHEVDMAAHLLDRDRPGPGAAAREADRRAVGRLDGRLPGRRVPAAVGRVERPVPRRRSATSGAAQLRRHPRPSRPGWPARPTCTPTTAARRTPRSTSSPPTTASPCATWSPTTTSTTRPTARTTATAPTTTGRGTTASRARPTTRRSSRCAAGRRPT